MEEAAAEDLALDLMRRHGLPRRGWTFAWSRATRRCGSASEVRRPGGRVERTIRLSRHFVRLNDAAEVRDTILHEIAHALVGTRRGHDGTWKAKCVEIGARPERLAHDAAMPAAKWNLTCGVCGRTVGTAMRRMNNRRLGRRYCRGCGEKSVGRLRYEAA